MCEVVEVWGDLYHTYCSYLIKDGWVINGGFRVKTDPHNNTLYCIHTKKSITSCLLGYVEYSGDYNKTMKKYNDTHQTLPINQNMTNMSIFELEELLLSGTPTLTKADRLILVETLSHLINIINDMEKSPSNKNDEPPF